MALVLLLRSTNKTQMRRFFEKPKQPETSRKDADPEIDPVTGRPYLAPTGLPSYEELRAGRTPEQIARMDAAVREEMEALRAAHPEIDPSEVMSWDGNTVELW